MQKCNAVPDSGPSKTWSGWRVLRTRDSPLLVCSGSGFCCPLLFSLVIAAHGSAPPAASEPTELWPLGSKLKTSRPSTLTCSISECKFPPPPKKPTKVHVALLKDLDSVLGRRTLEPFGFGGCCERKVGALEPSSEEDPEVSVLVC